MTKHDTLIAAVTEARFPLAALRLSPMNPRQHVPEAEVAELAASILAVGLIQNIAGLEDGNGGVEIVAGGRRLRALHYLAAEHPDLAEHRPELASPMVMLAPDALTAQAWATMENVARRDLHPADEIRAYGKMEKTGTPPAMIARAFAVTEKHVYRRLALAHLPEPVIEALAQGEISLSMAQCFTICDDEALALDVLDKCRGEVWNDYRLKQTLKPQSVRGTDRRAAFVGEDAYREAGGRIGGDLFAEETLFDDPALLDTLFAAKLAAEAEAIRAAQGWKWAEALDSTYIGYHEIEDRKLDRIYRTEGMLSEEEAERYDTLSELAEGEVLDEDGGAELATLQAILDGEWSDDQKTVAGVLLYVNQSGQLQTAEGMVKREDRAAAIEAGVLRNPSRSTGGADAAPKSPISAKLQDDLDRIAKGARQHAMLRDHDLLVDLLAYQLSHALHWEGPLGLSTTEVPNWPSTEAEGYALDERLTANPSRDMYGKDLAKSFRAFRAKGAEHVRGELARFLAAQYRGGQKALVAMIDKETSPNIREVWTPTAANFFSRVGGPYLNALWRDLLDLAEDHPTATTFAKLKKGEKAEKLEALFGDAGMRSALRLTEDQEARIAAWLPEGMD